MPGVGAAGIIARVSQPTALVLSGPPGVGKTTVGWRVFDRCIDLGLDPAFVDLDLLGAAWPPPDHDPHHARLKATNLAAVWSNYLQAGSRRLIIAGVVENHEERRQLEDAINAPVTICRLTAPNTELAHRIRHRGREDEAGLTPLITRAAELSTQLTTNDISNFTIPTATRPITEITTQILTTWLHPSD